MINQNNHAPEWSSNITVFSFNNILIINLTNYFKDDDKLTFLYTETKNISVKLIDELLILNSNNDFVGTENLTVIASDGKNIKSQILLLKSLNSLNLENKIIEPKVIKIKKIQDDLSFNTTIISKNISNGSLFITFYHTSKINQPITIIGNVNYTLSKNNSKDNEFVLASIQLVNGIVPRFRLKVGKESEVMEIGELEVDVVLEEKLNQSNQSSVIIIWQNLPVEDKNFNKIKQQISEEKKTIKYELINKTNLTIGQEYEAINALVTNITLEQFKDLKNNIYVKQIIDNKLFKLSLQDSVNLIGADKANEFIKNTFNLTNNFTHTGVSVCVLDTGIDKNHPAFADRIIAENDFVNYDSDASDDNGHGTHVAGIISSNGNIKGVSPETNLVIVKVCDSKGVCYASSILAGIDYCTANAQIYNISVISGSFGEGGEYDVTNCPSFFDDALLFSNKQGITNVFAAGNNKHQNGINYPACSPYSISVGATTKEESIAIFSNIGNNLDILAPGVNINSTWLNNDYKILSGTSMAVPHVSGVVASIQQFSKNKNKILLSHEIESVIKNNGVLVNISGFSISRIDFYKSILAVENLSENITTNVTPPGNQSNETTPPPVFTISAVSCDQGDTATECNITTTQTLNTSIFNANNLRITSTGILVNRTGNVRFEINLTGNLTIEPGGLINLTGTSCTSGTCTSGSNITIVAVETVNISGQILTEGGPQRGTASTPKGGIGGLINVTAKDVMISGNVSSSGGNHIGGASTGAGGDARKIDIRVTNDVNISGRILSVGGTADTDDCTATNGVRGSGGSVNISAASKVFVTGVINATRSQTGFCADGVDGIFVINSSALINTSVATISPGRWLEPFVCDQGALDTQCFINEKRAVPDGTVLNISGDLVINVSDGFLIPSVDTDVVHEFNISAQNLTVIGSVTSGHSRSIHEQFINVTNFVIFSGGAYNLTSKTECTGTASVKCPTSSNLSITSFGIINISGEFGAEGPRGQDDGGHGVRLILNATTAVLISGRISTKGGRLTSGGTETAGFGGQINITTKDLVVSGIITSDGGNHVGGTSQGAGGDAENITIIASNDINITGIISSVGGTSDSDNCGAVNGVRGDGADILIDSLGNIVIQNSIINSSSAATGFCNNGISGLISILSEKNISIINTTILSQANFSKNIVFDSNDSLILNSSKINATHFSASTIKQNGTVFLETGVLHNFISINNTNISPIIIIKKSNENGSITFGKSINITFVNQINQTTINITQSKISVDSLTFSEFNVSANISLNNVNLNNPIILFDSDNDGAFAECINCTQLSYVNNIFQFNVTKFSTYTIQYNACTHLNSDLTLNVTLNTNGSCLILNQTNIKIDCRGFGFAGNSSGIGINITNFANVSIQNCLIQNFTEGIVIRGNTNITVFNNTIQNVTIGIISIGQGDNITNNTIINTTTGISLNTSNNTIVHLNTILNTTYCGILVIENNNNITNNTEINNTNSLCLQTSNNTSLKNNIIENNSIGLNIDNSVNNTLIVNNTLKNNLLQDIHLSNNTNTIINNFNSFIEKYNITTTSGLVLVNPSSGNITFTTSNLIANGSNLSIDIQISNNKSFINSSKSSGLNTSANITLFNYTISNPEIIVDLNGDDVFESCPNTICGEINITSTFAFFNVTRFSAYSIRSESAEVSVSKRGKRIFRSQKPTTPQVLSPPTPTHIEFGIPLFTIPSLITNKSPQVEGLVSVELENLKSSNITCAFANREINDIFRFVRKNFSFNIPKDFKIIEEPFNIICEGENLDLTFNIPNTFQNVTVLRCKDDICKEINKKNLSNEQLLCAGIPIEEIRIAEYKDRILPPPPSDLFSISKTLTIDDKRIEKNKYALDYLGNSNDIRVEFNQVSEKIDLPKNPSLIVAGQPLILKITKNENPITVRITLPILVPTKFDNTSFKFYTIKNNSWVQVKGEVNTSKDVISITIPDLSIYLNEQNFTLLTLFGSPCYGCDISKLRKVYDGGGDDAIILVHGFMSNPVSWQALIDDFILNKQDQQIWVFEYPSNQTIEKLSQEFFNYLQIYYNGFKNIYFVGHSLGGFIIEQTLEHASKNNQNILNKSKSAIIIGTPHEGTPVLQLFEKLMLKIINEKLLHSIFNVDSTLLKELMHGKKISVPEIPFYVISGKKSYDFTQNLFLFNNTIVNNDGITTTLGAQKVGQTTIFNNVCDNYFETHLTHTELTDNSLARRIITRLINKENAEKTTNKSVVGYNSYLEFKLDKCNSNETLIIIGKPLIEEKTHTPMLCNCGNDICGIDESPESCPSDCMNNKIKSAIPEDYCKKTKKISSFLTVLLIFILLFISLNFYKNYKFKNRNYIELIFLLIILLSSLFNYKICKDNLFFTNLLLIFIFSLLIFLIKKFKKIFSFQKFFENKKSQQEQASRYFLSFKLGKIYNYSKLLGIRLNLSNKNEKNILEKYIIILLKKSYEEKTITYNLSKNGWPIKLIKKSLQKSKQKILEEYVKLALDKNYSKQKITISLKSAGWKKTDIARAIKNVSDVKFSSSNKMKKSIQKFGELAK